VGAVTGIGGWGDKSLRRKNAAIINLPTRMPMGSAPVKPFTVTNAGNALEPGIGSAAPAAPG